MVRHGAKALGYKDTVQLELEPKPEPTQSTDSKVVSIDNCHKNSASETTTRNEKPPQQSSSKKEETAATGSHWF
jgi:hypothetical protein